VSNRSWGFLCWACVVAFLILILSPVAFHAAPQQGSGYHLIRNIPLGGEGSWDYITVDPDAKRIYIPRTTHVMVLDEVTGKVLADIPNLKGLHGVAVAPEFNRGFATGNDPKGVITVFDLKTFQITGTLPSTGDDADGILYDPASKRVFVNNGNAHNGTAIDAATAKVVGNIALNSEPEGAVADGKGSIFVNIVDKSEMVEYDTKTLAIKNRWPAAPCNRAVGLSMDRVHRRLFIGCQNENNAVHDDSGTTFKNLLVVMNADNGKVVASMPIGIGTDGTAYDPGTGDVFVTCRDSGDGKSGATYVFHQDSPDQYRKIAQVSTIYGARTISLDPKTHHIFSISTENNDPVPPTAANPNPRPRPVLSTFMVVEVGK
jgi:DNA-binding beta-propeller fold protein YncE